jgi:hypothetical protein
MWEALALTLCLGSPNADMSNCQSFANTWGPYETKNECLLRAEEMKETFPASLAAALGYEGPTTVLANPEGCEISDDAA